MGVFNRPSFWLGMPEKLLTGDYLTPGKLGNGGGSGGGKFLRDDQTFAKVTADTVDSGAATAGQKLKANGSGGASWG